MQLNPLRIVSLHVLAAIILSVIYSIKNFKYLNRSLRYLVFFLFFALCSQLTATTLATLNINNKWLIHVYSIGEYIFFHLYFHHAFGLTTKREKLVSILFSASVITFMVFHSVFIQKFETFNSVTRAIECTLLVGYSIAYYIKQLNQVNIDPKVSTKNNAFLILNSSIFIYFSWQFFMFLFSNYVYEWFEKVVISRIWIFNAFVNLFFYLAILLGLWKLVSVNKKLYGS